MTKLPSKCHPEKPTYIRGLCNACYMLWHRVYTGKTKAPRRAVILPDPLITGPRFVIDRDGASLSPREFEAMALYARHGFVKRVADEMGISDQTVKNHMSSTYRKLDVDNANEAFHKLGWLKGPDDSEVAAYRGFDLAAGAERRLLELRAAVDEELDRLRTGLRVVA